MEYSSVEASTPLANLTPFPLAVFTFVFLFSIKYNILFVINVKHVLFNGKLDVDASALIGPSITEMVVLPFILST